MHVGHMASHVCDTWKAMCVTHGMPCVNIHGTPCVNIHGTFEGYKYGVVGRSGEQQEGK